MLRHAWELPSRINWPLTPINPQRDRTCGPRIVGRTPVVQGLLYLGLAEDRGRDIAGRGGHAACGNSSAKHEERSHLFLYAPKRKLELTNQELVAALLDEGEGVLGGYCECTSDKVTCKG